MSANGDVLQVVSQSPKLGGLDLNGYCVSQGYSRVSLDGSTINDWHCVDSAGKKFGLGTGDACKWQYQTNAIARWDDFNDPFSWSCFGLPSTGGGEPIDSNTEGPNGDIGKRYTYSCPPNTAARSVWGTDTYTRDSRICSAAVHAGLITFANGGTVTLEQVAGQDSYTGSTRNGVTSASWGSYYLSYRFVR